MKEKTKEITPEQYATTIIAKKGDWAGHHVSVTYIHYALKHKKELPNVISIKNYGRFYTLVVPETLQTGTYNKDRKKESTAKK